MNQKQKEVVMHESKIEMKEEVFFLIDTIVSLLSSADRRSKEVVSVLKVMSQDCKAGLDSFRSRVTTASPIFFRHDDDDDNVLATIAQ
jgi:hypothetical protein